MTIIMLSTVLIACGTTNDKEPDKSISRSYVSEMGTIRFNKDGAVPVKDEVSAEIVLDIVFDPACPSCSVYDDRTQDTIVELLNEGRVELVYHPVAFLNDRTQDDYSNRAGSYILAVTEYVPKRALDFIHIVMSEEFTSELTGSTLTPDSKFIRIMEDLEFTEEEIDKIESNKEGFVSKLLAATNDFIGKDSDWVELSSYTNDNGEQYAYTPFVLVNKAGEKTSKSLKVDDMDSLDQDLLKSINDLEANKEEQ